MNKPIDSEAQCIIDDGEGTLFLCPAYKRDEAIGYFEKVYEDMDKDGSVPPPLPPYLLAFGNFDNLIFYKAKIGE